MGARVHLCDRPGYAPAHHDHDFMKLVEECCVALAGEDRVSFRYDGWDTGSTDFGDVTCVMPGVQFNSSGASGTGHGIDYFITDPEQLCLGSAKAQLLVVDALLSGEAAKAKNIVENYKPVYPSIKAYFEDINNLILDKDAVVYDEDGRVTVDFFN